MVYVNSVEEQNFRRGVRETAQYLVKEINVTVVYEIASDLGPKKAKVIGRMPLLFPRLRIE